MKQFESQLGPNEKNERPRISFAHLAPLLSLLCLGVSLACNGAHKADTGSDTETNWLKSCDADTDCAGYTCECGVCTSRCETSAECSMSGAVCSQAGDGAHDARCGNANSSFGLCLEAESDSGQTLLDAGGTPVSPALPEASESPGSVGGPAAEEMPAPDAEDPADTGTDTTVSDTPSSEATTEQGGELTPASPPAADTGMPQDSTEAPSSSQPCAAGTYDHDEDPETPCQALTSCDAGEYVQSEGSSASDRICAICSSGTYSDVSNASACSLWTACSWTELETQAPSATTDRSCGPGSEYRWFGTAAFDRRSAVAVDPQGNVLVAGTKDPLTKYDPNGNELWAKPIDLLAGTVRAHSVAADSQGNVLVALSSEDGATVLAKYDPDANELWFVQVVSSLTERDAFVTLDDDDNVIVAGTDDLRPFVGKYDAEGNEVWLEFFSGAPTAFAHTVAVDREGNVLVAGDTNGILSDSGADVVGNIFVRKYDPDGTRLWTKQFGSNGWGAGDAVATDSKGNVLVAGYTDSPLQGTHAGLDDAFVRKYDPDGNELWTQQFGTSGSDNANAVAVDSEDNVLVAGYTLGIQPLSVEDSEAFVHEYDSDGNELWTEQFGSTGTDRIYGVAADGGDRVFVVGYSELAAPEGTAFVRLLEAR